MKALIILVFLSASMQAESQVMDTACYINAFSLEEASLNPNCELYLFLSDLYDDSTNNNSNVYYLDSSLRKFTNLKVLSLFTDKLIRINTQFGHFKTLEELTLYGYYDEHSIGKSISKCNSLRSSHIYIIDSSSYIPFFARYLPKQSSILFDFKLAAINYKKLGSEVKSFFKKTKATVIVFGLKDFLIKGKDLTQDQVKLLNLFRYYERKKKSIYLNGVRVS